MVGFDTSARARVARLSILFAASACNSNSDTVPTGDGGTAAGGEGPGSGGTTGGIGNDVGDIVGGILGGVGGEEHSGGGTGTGGSETDPGGNGGSPGSGSAGDEGAGNGGSSNTGTGNDGGAATNDPATVALPARIERYVRATSPQLILEIDSVPGYEPKQSSIDYVTRFFSELLDKPDGITVELDEELDSVGSDFEWSSDTLSDFSREHAQDDSSGPVRIHVVSVDGHYVDEESPGTILGLAWGNRYVALFQDDLRSPCDGLLGGLQPAVCELAERNVWAHELGHVIGLVDNGLPMVTPHRDLDHGAHDVNEGCLMYWAYDGAELFDTLLPRLGGADENLPLCQDSTNDIQAAR